MDPNNIQTSHYSNPPFYVPSSYYHTQVLYPVSVHPAYKPGIVQPPRIHSTDRRILPKNSSSSSAFLNSSISPTSSSSDIHSNPTETPVNDKRHPKKRILNRVIKNLIPRKTGTRGLTNDSREERVWLVKEFYENYYNSSEGAPSESRQRKDFCAKHKLSDESFRKCCRVYKKNPNTWNGITYSKASLSSRIRFSPAQRRKVMEDYEQEILGKETSLTEKELGKFLNKVSEELSEEASKISGQKIIIKVCKSTFWMWNREYKKKDLQHWYTDEIQNRLRWDGIIGNTKKLKIAETSSSNEKNNA